MAFEIELRVENVEQVQQGLEFLFDSMRIRTRETFKEWGLEIVDIAKAISPEDPLRDVDPRRRHKDQRFALQWRWEITQTGPDPGLVIGNVDPRMPIIIGDTPAVQGVTSKGPWPLKFWSDQGGPFYAWSINKPSTPGQPVHEWAIEDFDLDRQVGLLANQLVRQ